MTIAQRLSEEFHIPVAQVEKTIGLLDDGNTIPFIARYRKEITGSLDDQVLRRLAERLSYLRRLDEQREKIREAIRQQEKLTPELETALCAASTLTELEDIYLPFRPKRRTRAAMAREKGLQPLADRLYAQRPDDETPTVLAQAFLSEAVKTTEDALQGARDILAQEIADDAVVRRRLRAALLSGGWLCSRAGKDEDSVYASYYQYREPLSKAAGHRILAVNRGEREGFLKVEVAFDRNQGLSIVNGVHLRPASPAREIIRQAAEDAYDRLLFPAMEREIRSLLTERASADAVRVFGENLRQLLMQPPVRGRVTLGLDPGYRTGCKAAVVDATGKVLETGVIYPAPPHSRLKEAGQQVARWVAAYGVTLIAIGNGTASHETEVFVSEFIREHGGGLQYVVVSEAGASVYSASKCGAEEFPTFDVSVRSAVSIARRLQDPLAELVKIDPKAIGVGQYQHDLPQAALSAALDGVVEDCVHTVGVDLNTASAPLLARVSGIGDALSKKMVQYRETTGAFPSRAALRAVPGLGAKAFEQCAGFLRVMDSDDPLDHTAVHPESYAAALRLLDICGLTLPQLSEDPLALGRRVAQLGEEALARQLGIGLPTLQDIVEAIGRPGRDPREELPPVLLRTDVLGIEALRPGMELTGTVRNVVDFGAFVDIGVHEDGLVHISRITERFIRHPSEVLKVGDIVRVWVLSVDPAKKRIGLSMRLRDAAPGPEKKAVSPNG